jgi:hypothetical protein
MDLTAITSAGSGLKTLYDLAKATFSTRDAVVTQTAAAEFLSQLTTARQAVMDAQSAQTDLTAKVASLNAQIEAMQRWNVEKQRYKLTNKNRALVYSLCENVEPPEVAHDICPTCFQRGSKSILQTETRAPGRSVVLVCHECGADFYIEGSRHPEHGRPMARPPRHRA